MPLAWLFVKAAQVNPDRIPAFFGKPWRLRLMVGAGEILGVVRHPVGVNFVSQLQLPPWHKGAVARMLVTDAGAEGQTETRHDAPRDRLRWHFAARPVHSRAVEIRPEG